MSVRLRHTAVGALSCAAIILAVPAVAGAATPSPSTSSPTTASATSPSTSSKGLTKIQARAAAAISARLTSLNRTIPEVSANTAITSTDKATLLARLNGDVSGLTALGHTIAADTTAAQAATDAATIFTTYRVYALALPQVRFAEVADDYTGAVLPRLSDAQAKLAALLAGADSAKNTAAVQAAMSDLSTKIGAANTAVSGLSATVLAYTPAQYNANHALLDGPRQQLVGARADVKAARADIATVMQALK